MTRRTVPTGLYGRAFAENLQTIMRARATPAADIARYVTAGGVHLTADMVKDVALGRRHATIDEAVLLADAVGQHLTTMLMPSSVRVVPDGPLPRVLVDQSARKRSA